MHATFLNRTTSHRRNGFTMIELLVVTTIIIVLTTVGLVSFRSAGQSARNGRRQADLETVRQALVLYKSSEGTYPTTGDFDTMVTTISDYVSATTINDPRNEGAYVYEYSSDGTTFTLTAYLEPDATAYQLTSP